MKFLIVGASGFVGRHTYDYAKSLGYKVLGTQAREGDPHLIVFDLLKDRIADCLEDSFLRGEPPIFGIICAGIASTDRCFLEKERSHEINVTGTIRLIEDLVKLNIKPVYLSTSAVFDGRVGYYPDIYPYSPLSEYGRQKVKVEEYIRTHIPQALILRLDKVVDDDVAARNMFSEWYQLIRESKPILCIEDQLFAPTSVKDVAKAIILSCQKGLSGCYNLANTEFFLRVELLKQFMLAMGESTQVVCKPADQLLNLLEPRGPKSYLDSSKFVQATDIKFTSMRTVINNFLKNMNEKFSVFRRTTCRVCENSDIQCVLKAVPTPVGDSYVPEEKLKEPQQAYPLDLFLCRQCSAVQLLDVIDPKILYGNYIYKTSISLGLARHFERYAEDVLQYANLAASNLVIDIGSNDGTLLQAFKKKGMDVLGIDPAPEAAKNARNSGIKTIQAYFNLGVAKKVKKEHGPSHIVTANNILANIDDLGGFIKGIKELLVPKGIFVFETGYLVDLIKGRLIDVIYHEHLTYFTAQSLQKLFVRHEMELIEAQHISSKGGSLRCFAQKQGGPYQKSANIKELIDLEAKLAVDQLETYQQIESEINATKKEMLTYLRNLKKEGKSVAGYGASVGVTTLLYLFGLDEVLDFIVDDNPDRHNLFSPGHHIPVYPSSELYQRKPDCVVILAWRYKDPIMNKHAGYLEQGGEFIIPLPGFKIVNRNTKNTAVSVCSY